MCAEAKAPLGVWGKKNSYFRLYPNPNNGNFVLEYSYETEQKAVFYLYDVLGKNIKTIDLTGEQQNVTINESNLFNGLYFYELRVNGRIVKTDKLLIIK